MKVPLKWLARYVELDRDADQLAQLLTASGTEVESIDRLGAEWDNLTVAEILHIEKHPNADRLHLATVNTGASTMRVVCGAPNIAAGQKVPFAPVGALIQGHALEARPIRGIVSEGMLCAADELGLSPDHSGILILDPSETPGKPLQAVLGDEVLNVSVKPGRGDCLGMIGIAREVSALSGKPLRLPSAPLAESGAPIAEVFQLRIDCPDLCPRFVARLIRDVEIAQSPWWLQQLLHASGVRAINNVVDVTNYIMLDWGKPIHAYDFDYLRGAQIIVRRATEGEVLRTLDGIDRTLSPDMCVIADAEGGIGLGGIMGGADSEVKDATRNVLLESADFDAVTMRRTAKRLGMHSEAVRRFERGVDPAITAVAADHACYWFAELAGGKVAPGALDVDHEDRTPRVIDFDPAATGRLLGKSYSAEHCSRILTSLGFETSLPKVVVPSWRLDVLEPADLVEEIARITGYDDLPVTMPTGEIPLNPAQPPEWATRLELEDRLRELLKGAGLNEAVTYSLIAADTNSQLVLDVGLDAPGLAGALLRQPLPLANPMSEDQAFLRTTLLPSLTRIYEINRRQTDYGRWFFEVGRAYWPRGGTRELPEEKKLLGLILGGPNAAKSWLGEAPAADYATLHGLVELILRSAGAEARFEPVKHPSLHPGRSSCANANGEYLGYFGELHPLLRERLGLGPDPVLVSELDLEALVRQAGRGHRYEGIRRFPPVGRQITVALDRSVEAAKVKALIEREGGDLLTELGLADVFELPDGRRSLSYSFSLQSDERTLTDDEANQVRDGILAALKQELGAEQR
ncbi:MAG: phenylalanine--tRNA ligase subunit beta [Chloroflexi bacterium]|nr:phenylalanine--tRNA ligase subunit beta [Chloroflexota bacterium]